MKFLKVLFFFLIISFIICGCQENPDITPAPTETSIESGETAGETVSETAGETAEETTEKAGKEEIEIVKEEIKVFPLDNLEGIINPAGIELDSENSSDTMGSLYMEVTEPTVINLLEVENIDIENATLIYEGDVKTEDLEGQVYLEMWCSFKDKGEFFSRGLGFGYTLTGTEDWTTLMTPFFLKKGENPDSLKLNLVIDGKGKVWIDNIKLFKGPLYKI